MQNQYYQRLKKGDISFKNQHFLTTFIEKYVGKGVPSQNIAQISIAAVQ